METEDAIKSEVKTTERRILMIALGLVVVVGGGLAALSYFAVSSQQVYIDKAALDAPVVELAPTHPGTLRSIFVKEGDTIAPGTVVAQVGTEIVKSTTGGLVISASRDIGKDVPAGAPVVSTIDPTELRVIGQIDENKGLSSISVGDPARFTVDAFGGHQFSGVVSDIAPTSHASGVVFNISNERQTQTFDVKVYFDISKYPELRNGMSARIWIYTK
jgi:multidrug resistance efflux pump